MTQTPPDASNGPETAVERVAALILQATQQAAETILNAATKAAADIAETATKVPIALSTPSPNGIDAEQLVRVFEREQANQNAMMDPFTNGIMPGDLSEYDPELDVLVDSQGTRWNPTPGEEPVIPSPDRESFAVVPPGTPLVPQLPRFDN